jgi:hypothetical protein
VEPPSQFEGGILNPTAQRTYSVNLENRFDLSLSDCSTSGRAKKFERPKYLLSNNIVPDQVVPAKFYTSSSIMCIAPCNSEKGFVSVEVSNDGGSHWSMSGVQFGFVGESCVCDSHCPPSRDNAQFNSDLIYYFFQVIMLILLVTIAKDMLSQTTTQSFLRTKNNIF